MADGNSVLFVGLQFGSRFANSFLVSAARYELLELGGTVKFASAQVATSLARTVATQAAGLVADNAPLKRSYVIVEGVNVLFACVVVASALFQSSSLLFAVNLLLGLSFAFGQPITKSMPPAIVAREQDLAIVNSWDLTCDKVGRYLAPIVYAVVSSSYGFYTAATLCVAVYGMLTLLRMRVRVVERKGDRGEKRARQGLVAQVVSGVLSLKRDPVLRLLVLNTLVTNMLIYPVNSVVFPVLFKSMPEGPAGAESLLGQMLASLMAFAGIRKDQAWKNYTALVSLGGVSGPFLSNLIIVGIQRYSRRFPEQQNWVGLFCGMYGQVATGLVLAYVVFNSDSLDAGLLVVSLLVVWVFTIALNNIVTTFFNSFSQQRLPSGERGRFIANIMTIFTLGNSAGTLVFGGALAEATHLRSRTAAFVVMAILLRGVLLFLLARHRRDEVRRHGD